MKEIKLILPNTKVINIFTDDPLDINYFKDISNQNILSSIPYFDYLFVYSKKNFKKIKKKLPLFEFPIFTICK